MSFTSLCCRASSSLGMDSLDRFDRDDRDALMALVRMGSKGGVPLCCSAKAAWKDLVVIKFWVTNGDRDDDRQFQVRVSTHLVGRELFSITFSTFSTI